MNRYHSIDKIITSWIAKNGLHLFTTCKDEETRAVRLTDAQGRTYGIGIDMPSACQVTVRYYAWDFKKRNKAVTVKIELLATTLEEALRQVHEWMDV